MTVSGQGLLVHVFVNCPRHPQLMKNLSGDMSVKSVDIMSKLDEARVKGR